MKLKEACEYAEACGLETVGEAVLNIEIHAPSLFTYEALTGELRELEKDAVEVSDATPISKILEDCGNDARP